MNGKMTVTVILAYLVSELFFVTLVMFCITGLADQPGLHGCVSKLLCFLAGFIQWKTLARNETEEREKADYLLSHCPVPFSLTPAHARQSSAVDLAPDEQSPPLGSGSDTCLQAGISVASCYKSLNCSSSYALSVQSFITCVNNSLY